MSQWESLTHRGASQAERRATPREAAQIVGSLDSPDVGAATGKVVNISAAGCRIETDADLETWGDVTIGLSGCKPIRALVAWRRDNQYGCAFHAPLEATEVLQALSGKQTVAIEWLDVLEREHNHWHIPLDAVCAVLSFLILAAAIMWY